MKKAKFLLLTTLFAVVFALFGCNGGNRLTGTATMVIEGGEVFQTDLAETKFTDKNTALDLLQLLKDEQGLDLSMGGTMLISVGNMHPDVDQYIAVYHNKEQDKDVSGWPMPQKTYDGNVLFPSGLGIADLKLCDGIIIYFAVIDF